MRTCFNSLAIATIGMALSVPAFGQSNAEDEARVEDNATIIVTATRREQAAIDVPQSITALSGAELARTDKDDLADYIRQVPSVMFRQQSAGLNQISIRGVSGGGGQRAKAPISFYIDDVPVVSDPVATPDIKTFDVNRVEILRGPQGTLFGESALGGVIRIVTNAPDPNTFAASVRASLLDFKYGGAGINLDAMINVPLVADTLAFRAVVSRRDEDGWIDNIGVGGRNNANNLDYWSGRAKLLFTPSPDIELSASYALTRSDYGSRQEGNRQFKQVINVTNESRVDDIDQANITFKYDFGAAELTSSSNYFKRTTSRLFNLNSFNGFLPGIILGLGKAPAGFQYSEFAQTLNIDDENLVQEVRLVSKSDQALRWVVGAYYFDTKNFVGVDFFGTPDLNFNYLRLRRDEKYRQIAAFGELEYDFTDRLTAIAGLRYTDEKRRIRYDQSDDFPFVVFLPADGIFNVNFGYNILTPRFALKYEIADDAQIYASATRGFRGPGGNTDFNNSGSRNNVYGAETIWSYELGFKGQFFNRLLTVESAIFKTDWKDRQEVVNPQDPPTAQFADNIGSAKIWGGELGLTVRPMANLAVGMTYSYIDTEITDSARASFIGLGIPGEAKHRGSVFFDAGIPLTDDLELVWHADAAYSGSVFYSLTNPTGSRVPEYWLANMSIGVQADKWSARLFARNLTDEFIRYGTGLSTSINEPRVIGLTVQTEF